MKKSLNDAQRLMSLFLALFLLALPVAHACMPGDIPVLPLKKQLTVWLEGMPETVEGTIYRAESFALWYDAAYFTPSEVAGGVRFDLSDNTLGSAVSFRVERVTLPGALAPLYLLAEEGYLQEGWAVDKLMAESLPTFSSLSLQEPVQGFIARKGEDRAQVFLLSTASGTYRCTLYYPLMAAEGWAARMLAMLDTLEGYCSTE